MLGLTMYQWLMLMASLVTLSISFIAVRWVYFKILKIAKDKNIVDNPDARKLQKAPIPVMGGIAVFFGVLVGVLASLALPYHFPIHSDVFPALCAMSIMLYVGAMDDIVGLTAKSRFTIEILTIIALIYSSGCCVDTLRGLWGVYHFSWWIGVPLTVLTGVGIINAVNMIDGVNGLSSGLCIVCGLMFGLVFLKSGDMPNAFLAFAMTGSLMPFIIHNVFGLRSRMFIGDAGTMVMGMLMTWFVMCILRDDTRLTYYAGAKGVNLIALVLAILSLPVADTLRVMTMRILKGRSPFSPDKTHLHHVFINIGVSHSVTALTEIILQCLIVLIWGISVKCTVSYDMQLYLVICSAMVLVWGTYFFLRYHIYNHTTFLHFLTHFSIATHMGRTNWWKRITAWLDAPELENEEEERMLRQSHLNMKYEHNSPYDVSKEKIVNFMRGKAEVYVQDIKEHSGAEATLVDVILNEILRSNNLVVIKEDEYGKNIIVALTD